MLMLWSVVCASVGSEGAVIAAERNAAFRPIRARIQGEAATQLLKPCEDAEEFD